MTTNRQPLAFSLISLVIAPLNFWVWLNLIDHRDERRMWLALFLVLALTQLLTGIWAFISGLRDKQIVAPVLGALSTVGALIGGSLGVIVSTVNLSAGGAWGRPLRIRGRQVHPELCEGSDWTQGPRPDPSGLDEATRSALQALWLHDAQKEHASVPAFSRVSWMLAAAGAPAELLEWCHRAAMEEIAHTRACFALAAGYGGTSYTVEPMPELLLSGSLGVQGNAFVTLASESLSDGCQLEDFNADVAAACAKVCAEPVTRSMLETIAREERSHAELSWAIVEWLVTHHREAAQPALERALASLASYPRPTAVSADKLALVARASPALLRQHGRVPDEIWASAWADRLVQTQRRLHALLSVETSRAA